MPKIITIAREYGSGGRIIAQKVADLLGLVYYDNREFDSCLQFFTNQIAQNVDYINAFEFFYCQIRENKCTNMG